MITTARIIFLIVCGILPILIGLLHLFVHFKDLIIPEVKEKLQFNLTIGKSAQPIWYSWGIMSVMMGASFVVIGLINVGILYSTADKIMPPAFAVAAMIFYQLAVTYVGKEYKQAAQLYGGLFGLIMNILLMVLILRGI